ncbi:MAG: chemotaxis-specific protein-glutamate methyltransferase CheB [Planctomycetota bacterium]
MSAPVRVLLVDDSRVHRAAVAAYLERAEGIELVAEASDGAEGVERTLEHRPDLVLMDVRMPALDGLEATSRIMAERATPILLMTAAENMSLEVDLGLRALERGALELIPKPDLETLRRGDEALARRIRLLAKVPVIAHPRGRRAAPPDPAPPLRDRPTTGLYRRASRVVVVCSSTGGPSALLATLSRLPGDLPAALVLVQHIDGAFEEGLARWLDESCALSVAVGKHEDPLVEGRALLAPQGMVAEVDARRRLLLRPPSAREREPHCPSGDALFHSAARAYGSKALGVVLTGIGSDGATGLLEIHRAGGQTVAQDEATSVVYGMPRVARELGAAAHVVPLPEMARTIVELLR